MNSVGEQRWVLIDGDASYVLGQFDGRQFTPETGKLRVDYGSALYATQTWKRSGGIVYQMAWMRYPLEPKLTWNGQMSFPVKLTLRKFPQGIRLCREPMSEIDNLRVSQQAYRNMTINGDGHSIPGLNGDLLDLQAEIKPHGATEFGITVHGQEIRYSVADHRLQMGTASAPLELIGDTLRLRILVDRSSIEVFADDGEVTISTVILDSMNKDVGLFSKGGEATVVSLEADHLESIWLGDSESLKSNGSHP